jgi:hypothetical protein
MNNINRIATSTFLKALLIVFGAGATASSFAYDRDHYQGQYESYGSDLYADTKAEIKIRKNVLTWIMYGSEDPKPIYFGCIMNHCVELDNAGVPVPGGDQIILGKRKTYFVLDQLAVEYRQADGLVFMYKRVKSLK